MTVGKTTKYDKLVQDVRKRIFSGELKPGARLPGQFALAREYGVSSITANHALNVLRDLGLVERRERSGSFVVENPRLLTEVFAVCDRAPAPHNSLLAEYWDGITSRAESTHTPCQIISARNPLFDRKVLVPDGGHGVILIQFERDDLVEFFKKNGIPCVVLGAEARKALCSVFENRRTAARALARKMIDAGARRIAFMANIQAANHRLARDGYAEEMYSQKTGWSCVKDVGEETIAGEVRALLEQDDPPDAFMIMGAGLPVAALPVILQSPSRPMLGVFAEGRGALQLKEIAYVADYSHVETGKLAFDLLYGIASGKVNCATTNHPGFEILSPSRSR